MIGQKCAGGETPEISVIVPVYNVALYLAACLDSLLAQTFRAFEVILIEDGSTDDSRAIAERYAARDARIVLVRHRWNHGVTAARNLGLELASGRYVVFVDSDDIVASDYLALLYQVAEQQQADIVQACFQEFSAQPGDGQVWQWVKEPIMLSPAVEDRVHCFVPMVRLHIAPWCKLYRRAFLDAHRMVFYDMPVAEDVSFHYQGLLAAGRYAVLPDILYHYRVRPISRDHAPDAVQRVQSYVIASARTMEQFSAWLRKEPRFSEDVVLQRELRYLLCRFFMYQLPNGASLTDTYACCLRALADEPHEQLFQALLYENLRDSQ